MVLFMCRPWPQTYRTEPTDQRSFDQFRIMHFLYLAHYSDDTFAADARQPTSHPSRATAWMDKEWGQWAMLSGWSQRFDFSSVRWYCSLGGTKGIRTVKTRAMQLSSKVLCQRKCRKRLDRWINGGAENAGVENAGAITYLVSKFIISIAPGNPQY